MDHSGFENGSPRDAASVRRDMVGLEIIPDSRMHVGAMAEASDPAEKITLALEQPSMISVAQTNS